MKLAGSGPRFGVGSRSESRSVIQSYEPADPDPEPYQNVTDPQPLLGTVRTVRVLLCP
jgi:hypothetical protein